MEPKLWCGSLQLDITGNIYETKAFDEPRQVETCPIFCDCFTHFAGVTYYFSSFRTLTSGIRTVLEEVK